MEFTFGIYSDGTGGSGSVNWITDPTVIANITNAGNWTEDGNGVYQYTGDKTGLSAGDFYLDAVNSNMYAYDGTSLAKWNINNYN